MLLQTVYVFGPLLGTVVKRPLWFDFYKRPLTEVITKSSYVFAIWKFDCAGIKPGILKLHAFCVLPGGSQPRGMGGGGGCTLYNGPYGEAPPERDTFFRLQVYERVANLLVEVCERVGKSVIWVCERANRCILWLYKVEKTFYFGD